MQYIMDSIPWYVWLLPSGVLIAAALWFFGPVILSVWGMLPTKVKATLAVIFTVGLAYFIGRNRGNATAREMQRRRDAEAVQNRERIHREVGNLSEPDVDKRLGKWMRD